MSGPAIAESRMPGDVRLLWHTLSAAGLALALGAGWLLVAGTEPRWLMAFYGRFASSDHYVERPGNGLVLAAGWGLWTCWAFALAARRRLPASAVLPPRPLWLYAYGFAVCLLFAADRYGWLPQPEWVWQEDGLFETWTVLLLLFAAGLLAAGARGSRRARAARVLALLMAFVLAVFAMEEISWGQRIFGLETPARLAAINHQQELNVHNLFLGKNDLIRLAATLLLGTVFALGRPLLRYLPWRSLEPFVPASALAPYFVLVMPSIVDDELFEAVVAPLIVLYALECRRRLVRLAPCGEPAAGGRA